MRALPTGVEIIDHVLGGITPGLPCVLAGPSGSGRTVLSIQLAHAALEVGRVVSLLCNEPAPFLLRQAESFGIDFTPWLQSGQLALLEMDAEIGSSITAQGTEALVAAIAQEQPLCSLLIVDPATVLTAGIFDESQLRASARGLVRAAGNWSVVLTVESERLALQQGLEKILGEVCGSFLRLSRDEAGCRRLEVDKTRSGVAAAEAVSFAIDAAGTHLVEVEIDRPDEEPEQSSAPPAEGAPEVEDEPAPAVVPQTRERCDPPARKRILVVDDDAASREALSKWLSAHYDVQTAHDGFEAMSAILAARPDLVILDLVMRRVTGYELLAAFQRGLDDVPRLVISSRFERPADRLSPLVLGATDLIAKPVERFELLHKVDLLLGLSSKPADIMDPHEAQALFATPGKSRVMEPDRFHERLERASRFGERFDIPSSIVSLRGDTGAAVDAFVEVAEADLRFEDAVLRVSARRAVVLLVATPVEDAVAVVDRLLAMLQRANDKGMRVHHEIHPARHVGRDYHWHDLFRTTDGDVEEPDG